MSEDLALIIFYGFIFSFIFLLGGVLRIILRPISNNIAFSVPWIFFILGIIIGKGNYFPNEKETLYWPLILSTIFFTFILRTIVCNIELKKTGKVGYFSDSGNQMIIGLIIGTILKLIF